MNPTKIVLLQAIVAAFLGAMLGAGLGLSLGTILVATPLNHLLGPRYSEFDVLGVAATAIIGCVGAGCAAPVLIAMTPSWRLGLRAPVMFGLLILPPVLILMMSRVSNRDSIWAAVMWLAAAAGAWLGSDGARWIVRPRRKDVPEIADSPMNER